MVTNNSLNNNTPQNFTAAGFLVNASAQTAGSLVYIKGPGGSSDTYFLVDSNGSTEHNGLFMYDSVGNTNWAFYRDNTSNDVKLDNNAVNKLTVDSSGNLVITGGITMSGSNTSLTNYSEGTWTPTVTGGSTAGTTSYTVQTARYRRIGSCVIVYFEVAFNSATGTGDLHIGGLPFTVANAGNIGAGGYSGGIALPVLTTCGTLIAIAGATYAVITAYGNGAGPSTTQMVASGDLRGTLIYNV